MANAIRIHLKGIVQGVGFRPFVYKIALELGIKGWVNNSSDGVNIHAEGKKVEEFYRRLIAEAPPLSRIVSIQKTEIPSEGYKEFKIIKSETVENTDVLISPDVATCQDCLKEMFDKENRRYRYPFINCTNCGPRYTIIYDRPYDRIKTTMADFPMCKECKNEYENPLDRRFHAQPVACEVCGPKYTLLDARGNQVKDKGYGIRLLESGAIMAVKGLGGFHLVCDAKNNASVKRLRNLKERGQKPFALMARNLDVAKKEVKISELEEKLLLSPAAPIVLMERKNWDYSELSPEIAPGLHTLGIMLPYTPIHHLLFEGSYDFLVMTSANLSGQPLIYKNEEALESLKEIADYFLVHNRDIYHPCDDSVIQIVGGVPTFIRRARGYVPLPLSLTKELKFPTAAFGGEMKNAFCLASGRQAFMSQYIGDMHGYENFERFKQEFESFQNVANVFPQRIVYDMHPEYSTTKFAQKLDLPRIAVQHHHAHLASVSGEFNIIEPVLGIICDGTGYGEDGKIWGFEFLYGSLEGYTRKAHLEYLPLPGGDAGAKHPLRVAYAYLKKVLSESDWQRTQPLWTRLSKQERTILDSQIKTGFQLFDTSSAGRLFDVVSALLDICTYVTYEGQAAIELESTAARWYKQLGEYKDFNKVEIENTIGMMEMEGLNKLNLIRKLVRTNEYDHNKQPTFDPKHLYLMSHQKNSDIIQLKAAPLFAGIIRDIFSGKPKGEIAYRFHYSLAVSILETALLLGVEVKKLILGGGVFQNKLLTEIMLFLSSKIDVQLFYARKLPSNDGGLAFGQVLIGQEYFEKAT